MSITKLEKQIDQAHSFVQIAKLLKASNHFNRKFLRDLYLTYHVQYDPKRQLFESDLDHPGIFYDCTYQDAKECVNSILRQDK